MPNQDFVQLDRIEWHIEDDSLPQHLVDALVDPESEEHDEDAYELLATYACAHVGLFLRYCFSKGMAGASALEQEDAVRDVASGAMTGVDYFLNFCDGKLFITEFSDEAQGFVRSYYGNEGLYWDDFVSVARRPYQVSEREINYSTLEALINERRKRGVFTKAGAVKLAPSKPWWKFWAGS